MLCFLPNPAGFLALPIPPLKGPGAGMGCWWHSVTITVTVWLIGSHPTFLETASSTERQRCGSEPYQCRGGGMQYSSLKHHCANRQTQHYKQAKRTSPASPFWVLHWGNPSQATTEGPFQLSAVISTVL